MIQLEELAMVGNNGVHTGQVNFLKHYEYYMASSERLEMITMHSYHWHLFIVIK